MPNSRLTQNYIYNLTYQVFTVLAPFITTPYISRVLGAEGIGAYSFTQSNVTFVILISTVGVSLYGQRAIAYKQHDREERSRIFFEIILMRAATVCVGLAVYSIFLVPTQKYHQLYMIQYIDIIASVIDITWFFQGMEEFKYIAVRNIFIRAIGIVLVFALVKNAGDVPLYALCYSVPVFLGNLYLWPRLKGRLCRVPFRTLRVFSHLKPCMLLFIPQIASQIYVVLDKSMLGFLTTNDLEVGYYEQGQKIVKVALIVVTSLGTVMMPHVAKIFSSGDHTRIQGELLKSFRLVVALAAPMVLGLCAIADNFGSWFYGPGYEKVPALIMIISPILLLVGLSNVIGIQYLLPTNRDREFTISVICGSAANVIMNLILIPRWGAFGASIASVFAEVAVLAVQLYIVRRKFSVPAILKIIPRYIVYAALMYAGVRAVSLLLPGGIITTGIQVFVGAFIYILLLAVRKDEVVTMIKKVVQK
ncbi:MAG: oligosaccharide flippase family protein [Gemmiger sp.]|nr:oligosaccharide flippase family protein [Gemmiger sp.]